MDVCFLSCAQVNQHTRKELVYQSGKEARAAIRKVPGLYLMSVMSSLGGLSKPVFSQPQPTVPHPKCNRGIVTLTYRRGLL